MSTRPHVRRRVLLPVSAALSAAALTTACYRYVPVAPSSVPASEEVHVRLTPPGSVRLGELLGGQPDELEGQIARRGDSLSVSVVVARAYRGVTFDSSRQALVLGPNEVAEVRRRQFSRSRTTLVAVGSVVGFALLVKTIAAIADPNPSAEEPLPPPPPALKIPFRIAIP